MKVRGGVSGQVSVMLRGWVCSIRELFEVNADRLRGRKDVDRGCVYTYMYL